MASRYRKKRKFGRKRNYVGSRRPLRKFFRKFRKSFKKNTRILRLNSKALSPRFSFIKISYTKELFKVNDTNSVLDYPVHANCLDDSADFGEPGFPYIMWQMAQMYKQYYVWKSKCSVWFAPYQDDNDVALDNSLIDQHPINKMFTAYIKADSSGATYTNANWGFDGAKDNPFDAQFCKYKNFTNYGALYKTPFVSNTLKTKRYFGQKTGTLLEYQGSITPTGTLAAPGVTCNNPASRYLWHIGILGQSTDVPSSDLKCRLVVKMTKWVKFLTQRNTNTHVIEDNVPEG